MELHDKFGNEIRRMTEEERDEHLPGLKKEVIINSAVFMIAALILGGMVGYFIAESCVHQYIIIFVAVLFGGALLKLIFDAARILWQYSSDNVGVLHIFCEDIGFSSSNSKRPSYYIKGIDTKTGKEICYALSPKEYEAIRTHFGHLKEIDYIILNPNKVSYYEYGSFIKLKNNGCAILSSAVYDDISKAVNNLSEAGGMLRAKQKDNN